VPGAVRQPAVKWTFAGSRRSVAGMRAAGLFVAGLLVLALGGCPPRPAPKRAASAGAPATAAAAKPFDVESALSHELEQQPNHEIAAADGSFKATLEATSPPTVTAGEGFTSIAAPLDKYTLTCFVYPQLKDVAELVRLIVADSLDKAAPNHEWIDVHGDQVAGWGYVVARSRYVVDGPKGKLVGDFKIAASARDQTTVACLLDAPGLYATFERGLRGLLGSLDVATSHALPKPVEASITRAQVPGRLVMMSRSAKTPKGGATVAVTYSASLSIGEGGTLVTSDEASTQSFKSGKLDGGSYASFSAGHMVYNLQLERHHKKYRVTGTAQDKPVEGEFRVEADIMDSERENAEVCKVRDGKAPEVRLYQYDPSADPLQVKTTLIAKSPSPEGEVVARPEGGEQGTELFVKLDQTCDMQSAVLKAGSMTMHLERMWHEKATP
jgi:hypothetical protein